MSMFRTSRYQTVTVSPVDSNVVYTAEKYARSAALPIYKSDDFGASWYLLSPGLKKENLQEFPKFHGKEPKMLGGSISHILPDCRDRNRLYFSNFWGVSLEQVMEDIIIQEIISEGWKRYAWSS